MSGFFFRGSSQSKEGGVEAKIDRLLTQYGIDPAEFGYRVEIQAEEQEHQR